MTMREQEQEAEMVVKALDAIPGYPFLPCPLCGGVEGCDHGIVERATAYEEKAEATRAHVVKSRDVDNKDIVNSEELIRGMTEMAERFTARMNDAGEQIDRLRAALLPFANARTKEGWFGFVPDSQAYVEARLALGLPWEPSTPPSIK